MAVSRRALDIGRAASYVAPAPSQTKGRRTVPQHALDKAPEALFASRITAGVFAAAGLALAAAGLYLWWRNGPGIFLEIMLAGIALCT